MALFKLFKRRDVIMVSFQKIIFTKYGISWLKLFKIIINKFILKMIHSIAIHQARK